MTIPVFSVRKVDTCYFILPPRRVPQYDDLKAGLRQLVTEEV